MSRVDKLKHLKNEISRLFREGLDEIAVVDQLRTDEQFVDVNHEEVQAFYSILQKKSDVEASAKRKIAVREQQILEHQQRIAEYEQQITGENRQTVEQKIVEHERELARKQQVKTEMEFMSKYQQISDKFFIYDEAFFDWFGIEYFWQGRFFMTMKGYYTSDNVHTIEIIDLFQSATKSFTIQELGHPQKIHALTFPFVLLHEFNSDNYFRLVKFDFESESLQVVDSFKTNTHCQILVSTSDASNFLLRRGDDVNECKLIGDKIRIGKKVLLDSDFDVDCVSYFDEQFCRLQFEYSMDPFRNHKLTQVKMLLHDLNRNEHSIRDLDSTSENFHCLNSNSPKLLTWIRDTVFITVGFYFNRYYGIIFTNPQMRNWKFVGFATDLHINCIKGFVDGTLLICSKEQYERKIYRLQMRKPDFLRNMAWMAIIKLFKEADIENPYEEARQYLPLNSEIQPFVFIED